MTAGVIIQARMTSSRLPGKILLPLGKKTVLDYVVNRAKLVRGAEKVVLACTVNPADDVLEEYAAARGVLLHRGSEDDVSLRYLEAAEKYGIETIVRITSDCPFIDADLASSVLSRYSETGSDVAANILDRHLPRGFDTEVFSAEALRQTRNLNLDAFYYEHVTPFFYENPDKFKLMSVVAEEKRLHRPDIRICIDEPRDYELLQIIAGHFEDECQFKALNIVELFEADPNLIKINADVAHLKQGGKT
ncbi:MAG: glycosyltransferase family protein [Candidatus Omnitrophica bacterium]|nr:glycosyltransferase family protein [Candidatus Omnitrophota bacterium]